MTWREALESPPHDGTLVAVNSTTPEPGEDALDAALSRTFLLRYEIPAWHDLYTLAILNCEGAELEAAGEADLYEDDGWSERYTADDAGGGGGGAPAGAAEGSGHTSWTRVAWRYGAATTSGGEEQLTLTIGPARGCLHHHLAAEAEAEGEAEGGEAGDATEPGLPRVLPRVLPRAVHRSGGGSGGSGG
ncbi:MAG: DUF5110 domain-containing protein, partial [Pseudomonadota bacterium]|nr:DUF5110 domain-containing protein [Pseudomonadota bacterium]